MDGNRAHRRHCASGVSQRQHGESNPCSQVRYMRSPDRRRRVICYPDFLQPDTRCSRACTPSHGDCIRPATSALRPLLGCAHNPSSKRSFFVRLIRTVTVSSLALFALAAAPTTAGAARALLIDGSTSIFPLMTQLASAYHKATRQPTPKVGQGTSDAGINDVNSGRVDIADVSRDPIIGTDPHGLIFTKIARDGVCLITSPKNPVFEPQPAAGAGNLHRAGTQLERSPRLDGVGARSTCSTAWHHPVRRMRSRTSSSACS